ncbi:hypothetical protein H2200_004586 [Cladophialophora chaetospira]|uniref:Uncharacterized protein n=1 Tax=Cladophialophora chaetospira TaxID=386627 RepID=A0AA39CJL6_9EURO|nr:hypothetical protein H2200_004586 [Cladophialophora chaetospira]
MSALAPHEQGSAFLRLPVETRLQIYHYLVPKNRLDVNLCDLYYSQPPKDIVPRKNKKPSPISTLVSQNLAIEAITRSNGLHLLLVSTRTAAELTALLVRVTVRFHCPKCFEQWLRNVSYGLGVGIKWLKQVEILFDVEMEPRIFGPDLQRMTPALSKFMIREMMKQCQHTAYAYYGRLDLHDPPREKWKYEPYEEISPLWAGHPNYLDRTPSNTTQAMFNATANGGLHMHPWVLNGGFPAPGMGLPPFHGARVTGQGLRRGLRRVVPNLNLPEDEEDDERGTATRSWMIKGWFNI